jgi:hypothetical protein
MDNQIPRRIQLDKMIPEELAIYNLVQQIENLGAHPLLTDVVVLLGEARSKLADWVEWKQLDWKWKKVEVKLRETEEAISIRSNMPGVNMMFYAGVFASLKKRFDGGERTESLYSEIMELD